MKNIIKCSLVFTFLFHLSHFVLGNKITLQEAVKTGKIQLQVKGRFLWKVFESKPEK